MDYPVLLEKSEIIERAVNQARSWFAFYKVPLASCLSERDIYHYNGSSDWQNVFYFIQNITKPYNFVGLSNRGYPFNDLAYNIANVTFVRQEIINVKNIIECAKHFDLPIYTNFIKALYNNIMGGLTKGTINAKVSIKEKNIEVDFVNLDKKLKVKKVIDSFSQQIEETINEEQKQFLTQAMQQEVAKVEKAYNQRLIQNINQEETEERLIADKIEQEINEMLGCEYNRDAIMSTIDSFFSTGFAVLETKFHDGKFHFCSIDRPEMCFFSPLATKKDKSDGGYCGRLRVVDRKQLAYDYDMSHDAAEKLQNFPAISIPSSMGMAGTPLQFFYGFGVGKEQEKNYLIIADCYYKEDGRIKKYVLCGNKVLEECYMTEFEEFPLTFIDSSNCDLRGQSSIFSHCFSVQKDIAWMMTRRAALTMNIIGGKMLLPSIDEATKQALEAGWYQDKPFVIANVSAGNNQIIQPQVIPNTDLPQGLLMATESLLQTLRFMVNDIMSNNQTTKNSQILGTVSGKAIENANLNQNNLFNKYLNIITSTFNKVFKNIIAKGLYHSIQNEDGIKGYISKLINRKIYDKALKNIDIDIDIITDTAVVRDRNRQFLENIIGVLSSSQGGDSQAYLQMFIKSLIDNTELQNKGDILNRIQEIQEERANTPPPEDPIVSIERQKLSLEDIKLQQNFLIEQLKLEHDKEKHIRDIETRILDSEMRYHIDVKNLDLASTKHAFDMINQSAKDEIEKDKREKQEQAQEQAQSQSQENV